MILASPKNRKTVPLRSRWGKPAGKFLCCVAIVLPLAFGVPLSAAEGVRWEPEFSTALQKAKDTDRLVLLHFYGDHCPPCRKMDREVFSSAIVADSLESGFISVKVDTATNPKAVKNLHISSIPADVVISPQGTILFRRAGASSAKKYVEDMSNVLAEYRKTNSQTPVVSQAPVVSQTPEILQASEVSQSPTTHQFAETAQSPTTPQSPTVPEASAVPQNADLRESAIDVHSAHISDADQPAVESSTASNAPSTNDAFLPFLEPLEKKQLEKKQTVNRPVSVQGIESETVDFAIIDRMHATEPTTEPTESTMEPASNPSLAVERQPMLEGFCPVKLQDEERWVAGVDAFTLYFKGQTYRFSDEKSLQLFVKDPARYIPVALGDDIVSISRGGTRVQGKRNHGLWYQGRIYLFSTSENYELFAKQPDLYASFAKKLEMTVQTPSVASQEK